MALGTFHQPVGTCRMGDDPEDGAVVDRRGRVRGIDGLFVADASVMPDITSAPTHLTVIMIAERVAEWLSGSEANPGVTTRLPVAAPEG